MNAKLLFIPFILQGLCMFVDEFYFHHKRGLPRWERIGHPLDTISVLICFFIISFFSFTQTSMLFFMAASIFSCVFIAKDESVHLKYCNAYENTLHAFLFVLHPLVLIAAGLIWHDHPEWKSILVGQFIMLIIFLSYQIGYWGFYEPRKHQQ